MKKGKRLEKKLGQAIELRDIDRIEAVFEEIYAEYSKLCAFIISKYVGKREDVEELTNDVFVNFSRVLTKIELDNIKFYLVTQAKNSAINHLKRTNASKNVVYVEGVELGEHDTYVGDDHALYHELLDELRATLSSDEVNIILLHTVYDKSFVEIAESLNRPVTTVKSTYHRAIAKFKKIKGIK